MAGFLVVTMSGCSLPREELKSNDLQAYAEDKESRVVADQEPMQGGLTLSKAIARAIKYNLDVRVAEMDAGLKRGDLALANYNLLPNLVASSGYDGRNNDLAADSRNIQTGQIELANAVSTDRNTLASGMGVSWNILDFGLSYVRGQQIADKALIAEEMRRKAVNRIVEDVRTAYWRALTADHLRGELRRLEAKAQLAMTDARALEASGQTSKITALTYQRELLEIQAQLLKIETDLGVAKMQLAALMNTRPDARFSLAPAPSDSAPATLDIPADRMVHLALMNRPELREQAYDARINEKEATAALLELLPGIDLSAGVNADSDSYLMNKTWVSWGAKASWNLMRVFAYPAKSADIAAQGRVFDERALSLTMAIMTQVHVSRARFVQVHRNLLVAAEYLRVQRAILDQLRSQTAAETQSVQTLIREEMNTLLAKARYDVAVAEVQNAYANVLSSMGLDPYSRYSPDMSVGELAKSLEKAWSQKNLTKLAQADRVAPAIPLAPGEPIAVAPAQPVVTAPSAAPAGVVK